MRLRYFTPEWDDWRAQRHLEGAYERRQRRRAATTCADRADATRGRDPRQRGSARARATRAGSPLRSESSASSPRPSCGRSRPPTGTRGTGTTEGGASPRPLLQSTCSTRSAASSGSAGQVPARVRARSRPRARASRRTRRCRRRRATARRRRATPPRRRRRARPAPVRVALRSATGGRPVAAAAKHRVRLPRRRPARRASASRPDRPCRRAHSDERAFALGVEDRGQVPGIRSQHRVLGERHRVVLPRAVHRRARAAHDPAHAGAAPRRRARAAYRRNSPESSALRRGSAPTIAARCTTVSTSCRYGARSAFTMSARWNVSFRARRAGSRTSSPTMRSTAGEASNSGSSRCPMNPEMPVTATVPRTTVDRLAQWPTFPKWDRDFRSRVASTSRS